MQCREFEDRLNAILDDRGQPRTDGVLVAHAAECEPCAQVLAGQEMLFSAMRRWPESGAGAGFAQRVVAQAAPYAHIVRAPVNRRVWLALGTVLTAAATMLLAVSVVWYARQGKPLAAVQDRVAPNSGPVIATEPSPRVHRGARGGTLALGQSSWIVEAPSLPGRLSENYHHALDNLATTLPETVQRFDEVERYAPGIKPLRVSFTVLLNALWRALPGGEDETSPQHGSTRCWNASAAVA